MKKIKCEICKIEFESYNSFTIHVPKIHNVTNLDYYKTYIGDNKCKNLNCLNETEFISFSKGCRKYCSRKCSAIGSLEDRKNTCLEKYGVDHPLKSDIIKSKTKNTNLEKYGVEYTHQNPEIFKKVKYTWENKYGVENISQLAIIKDKKVKTSLNNFGVENPMQSEKVRLKLQNTIMNLYGVDNFSKTSEYKIKVKNTLINKYGINYNKIIQNKLLKIRRHKNKENLYKMLNYLDLDILDIDEYLNNKSKIKFKCKVCNHIIENTWNHIQQGYNCPKCNPRVSNVSKIEKEILEYLKSIINDQIVENDRSILNGKELDIFIPSKNIAIEFNGLYWHSEEHGKDKNYHLNKTLECERQNIRLIQIFEDEWIFKKDIVMDRLSYIIGNYTNKTIYARKCIIKEISTNEKNNFLKENHIQGKDNSSIKLGAFYNDELISVMTFSSGNISKGSKNLSNIWELNRFCTKKGIRCIGIASKLLTHFKRTYNWNEIFSYADKRWSTGKLYKKLGFELNHSTVPNYWYVKGLKRIHRFNLRKNENDPKDIPEYIIRNKEGYLRVWDCGHYKFIMRN